MTFQPIRLKDLAEKAEGRKDFKPVRFKKADEGKDKHLLNFDFTGFEGGMEVFPDSLARSAGLSDRDFGLYLICQLVSAISSGKEKNPDRKNAATAALMDMEAGDSLEGLLITQMISVHHHAMDCMKKAVADGQGYEVSERYRLQAMKLMRTFALQTETLERYRRKGKQTVIVERRGKGAGGEGKK